MISVKELAEALSQLGVARGEKIGAHSSLNAFVVGHRTRELIEEQARVFIDGLEATVGPGGLIIMPTFTYCFEGSRSGGVYHPEKTRSKTGYVTEVFRREDDVVRSLQPTHSVAAWGDGAREIIADHENRNALGLDSPFHRLAQQGGKIVFVGTDFTTCSLIHVAETVAGAPYIRKFRWEHAGWSPNALVEADDGTVEKVPLEEVPGCSRNFEVLRGPMERAPSFRTAPLGSSAVTVFEANDLINVVGAEMRRDSTFLLCPAGTCPPCDAARL